MEQLAAGKSEAQQWLYDRYAGAVYGVILHTGIDTLAAQQVLAQTFDTVFAALAYKPLPNPRHALALLLQTARRLCPTDAMATTAAISPVFLQKFTDSLETPANAVFDLCYARNQPHQHAAATLQLSPQTVQALLSTSMVSFRKYLQAQ